MRRLWLSIMILSVLLLGGCGTSADPTAPLVVNATLNPGRVDQPYSGQILVSGGTPPYLFEVQGLRAGMTFDKAAGTISGTPLVAKSNIPIAITVQDSGSPPQVVSTTAYLTIKPLGIAMVTESPLDNGALGVYYSQKLEARNGMPPYTWQIGPAVGALPTGLSLNRATGVIEGIPREKGTFSFTVTVSDNDTPVTSDAREFTITIP